MATLRLVIDLIGLASVVLGAVAPYLPHGSRRRGVAQALGAVVPEAIKTLRAKP